MLSKSAREKAALGEGQGERRMKALGWARTRFDGGEGKRSRDLHERLLPCRRKRGGRVINVGQWMKLQEGGVRETSEDKGDGKGRTGDRAEMASDDQNSPLNGRDVKERL